MSTKLYKNNQLQDIAGNFVLDNALDAASDNGVKNKVVAQAIGTLSNLTTTEKSNVVGAINEINADLNVYYDSTDGKFYQLVNGQKGSEIEVGQKLPNYVVDVMGYNAVNSAALCTYIADNVNGTQLLVSGSDTLTQDKLNSDYILSSNPNVYYATFTVQKDCWFYPNNDPVPTLLPTGSTIQVGYAASGSNVKAAEGTFCFYN